MKKKIKNCWDFWGCEKTVKKECPAFIQGVGDKCWLVAGTFSGLPSCPNLNVRYDNCCECLWYKELNDKCIKSKK